MSLVQGGVEPDAFPVWMKRLHALITKIATHDAWMESGSKGNPPPIPTPLEVNEALRLGLRALHGYIETLGPIK